MSQSLNPLNPSIPIGDGLEADGYERLEDAGLLVDDATVADVCIVDEEVVDTEDGTAYQVPLSIPCPPTPSPKAVAKHNLTHLPYASWCPHCVAARRNNTHHLLQKSADRPIPLFVADYCFVKDVHDEELTTCLVGRLYPSRALFSVVVDSKGIDEHAVERLCAFLKDSGVTKLVYKCDQESSLKKLIEESLRRSGRAGEFFNEELHQVIAEHSAVGESASNGRAERAVQTFEDMLRTYKSALEARIRSRLTSDGPIMRWMVEHVSSIYNRHTQNPDGVTPSHSSWQEVHCQAGGIRRKGLLLRAEEDPGQTHIA